MTRTTIQDCQLQISDHFDLTLIAAKRARQLTRGATSQLPWANHKPTVLALQEIAAGLITSAALDEPDLPLADRAAIVFDPLLD